MTAFAKKACFSKSQSLIYNILLFGKYAMNYMTEIEEDMWELFLNTLYAQY